MFGVVGLIGVLLFLAGAHLLWLSRKEILYWLAEFFRIWRREFTRRADSALASPPKPATGRAGTRPRGTLRLLGGFGLLILGPLLLLLDLLNIFF